MQNTQNTIRTASFAIYRLPHESVCHAIRTEPIELDDVRSTTGHTGFVMAPFAATEGLPTLLFEGDPETLDIPEPVHVGAPQATPADEMTDEYRGDFLLLHDRLTSGHLRKVVLARSRTMPLGSEVSLKDLFAKACAAYPTAFVAVVKTPKSGAWLMATPELLVESRAGKSRTVALAGTMRRYENSATPQWSEKNRGEQEVVSRYVYDSISHIAKEFECGATETIASGDLLHLKTTFTFSPCAGKSVADIAAALHPTPAVCGMPKEAALRAITETEHCQRSYYSGFAGPVTANGDAALYVTIRCAMIEGTACTLFAGGGLMPESRAEDEWDETVAKMESIRRILF